MVASLAVGLTAFAQAQPAGMPGGRGGWGGGSGTHAAPGVFGTVTAVNGTTLTVTSKMRMRPNASSSAVTYTVDASNAAVVKNGASSTVASIATGDTVMVQGTVSGANVTATMIRDGVVPMPGKGMGRGQQWASSTASGTPRTLPIQGNGEPVIAGNITAISGSALTVTNASNVTYTIDVSNAKIVKNGTTTTLSAVATGDAVVVQGTVNGTSVTASSVIDQGIKSTTTGGTPMGGGAAGGGFFGMIGSFFKHLFGF